MDLKGETAQKEFGVFKDRGMVESYENLVVESDEAHADVRTLHTQRLDALQHGLLDKLEFDQII